MTLAEAKKIYESNGGKFFTKDTMEFWGTKVESGHGASLRSCRTHRM